MAEAVQPDLQPRQPAEPTKLPDSYAFVINVGTLRETVSLPLVEGHQLRRATPREIAEIKSFMEHLPGLSFNPRVRSLWECQWPRPVVGPSVLLPENEWRYFVIAFSGPNLTLADLQPAFDLASVELEIGFWVVYTQYENSIGQDPGRVFQVLRHASLDTRFFVEVGREQTEEIAGIHTLLQNYDHAVFDLRRILAELNALKGLPRESPLLFLGYFAILEALLTHAPKPTDPYDSITRQIKKKLALLNNRPWPCRIDYGPFGCANAETIWTRLYACRSTVAHGGRPDFTSGELRLLQSYSHALGLVNETAKAVILHALREPQLVVDLRDC